MTGPSSSFTQLSPPRDLPDDSPATPLSLIMRRKSSSKQGWIITTVDGNQRFTVNFLDTRVTPWPAIIIVDSSSDKTLCNIHRARDHPADEKAWKYVGLSTNGSKLFESTGNPFWVYRRRPLVMSVDQADGATLQLEAETRYTYRVEARLTVDNARIAFVKKQPWTAKREYHVHMSPGVDPLLVISTAIIMDHQCSVANLFWSAAVGGVVGVSTGIFTGPLGLVPGLLFLGISAGAFKTAGLPGGRKRHGLQIPEELNKAQWLYKDRRYV